MSIKKIMQRANKKKAPHSPNKKCPECGSGSICGDSCSCGACS